MAKKRVPWSGCGESQSHLGSTPVQYSTVQYSTAQCSTAQCSALLDMNQLTNYCKAVPTGLSQTLTLSSNFFRENGWTKALIRINIPFKYYMTEFIFY